MMVLYCKNSKIWEKKPKRSTTLTHLQLQYGNIRRSWGDASSLEEAAAASSSYIYYNNNIKCFSIKNWHQMPFEFIKRKKETSLFNFINTNMYIWVYTYNRHHFVKVPPIIFDRKKFHLMNYYLHIQVLLSIY